MDRGFQLQYSYFFNATRSWNVRYCSISITIIRFYLRRSFCSQPVPDIATDLKSGVTAHSQHSISHSED